MARVFLVNPPTPEPVRTPLLSFCYLAASLRARGHQVALLDASAPFAPKDFGEIAERIRAFTPDLVGLHLKTLYVQPAYALARALLGRFVLVAGGPHATVCPEEPLSHGFSFVLRGEAETSLSQLAETVDPVVPGAGARRRLEQVAGLTFRGPFGVRHNASAGPLTDLDALPSPTQALDLFDPAWYGTRDTVAPMGILSSRGCPAACTFCCNNVTGRRFRYRDADAIGAEVAYLRRHHGMGAFSFFDDSFAVGRRRVDQLCQALRRHAPGIGWTCTAHPAHLSREVLAQMQEAGCGGVDIGMESADPEMLLRIGKGVTVERVKEVLALGKELGLHMIVNLMFGWPDETPAQLGCSLGFMEEMADVAGGFNARGVLVPYPGTEIYDKHHQHHGFTDWWLREPPIEYEPFPTAWSLSEISRAYRSDAALERNFFHHSVQMRELMQVALDMKARLTFRVVAAQQAEAEAQLLGAKKGPPTARVPAAGAR